MAEGDGLIYNNFKHQVMEGEFDLLNDIIKVMLVSGHVPDIDAHTQYSDVSADEYGAGLGYTVTGEALAGKTVIVNNTDDRGEFDATDLTWSALGTLSPAIPSDAIMYDDTHASDLLIASWEIGVTGTNGGDYTLEWGATGIILLT
jgi:hypothetical protein